MNDIEFKVEHNFLKKRLESIKRFTCKEEKEILLTGEDSTSFSEICDILKITKPINELEGIAFIIKSSEHSVSDIYSSMDECPNCGIINENIIELENIINIDIESDIPIGLFDTPEDIINNTDILLLKDYNDIQDKINTNNKKILDLLIKSECRSCKTKTEFTISPLVFISKSSLVGFYEECFSLTYYGGLSLDDINNLYPFEREIYLGLTQKKIESQPNIGGA